MSLLKLLWMTTNGLIPWVRYVGNHTGAATFESTGTMMSSAQIWEIFTAVDNCREREDKNIWWSFLNSSRNIVQRSEAERSENEAYIRPTAGLVDRPVDQCAQTCTWQLVDCLVDRSRRTVDRPMTNRRIWAQICLSFEDSDFVSELETNPIRVS